MRVNSPGEEKSVVVAGTSLSPGTVMGSNPNMTVVSAVVGGVRTVTVNAPTLLSMQGRREGRSLTRLSMSGK